MSQATLTPAQLRPLLGRLRPAIGSSRVIGVHHAGRWDGPDQLLIEGETWTVRVCQSLLDVHAALADHAGVSSGGLVLVSPFERQELGVDVLSRLARQELVRPSPLRAVMSLFAASDVDRRVARQRWLLDELLRVAPSDGYAPAEAGTLTHERAWEELLRRGLGLPGGYPTLSELVRWGGDPANRERFASSPGELRAGFRELLADVPGASVALAAVEHGPASATVIGGIAARLLVEADGDPTAMLGAGRLAERLLGGAELDLQHDAPAWADAAERLVREHPSADDVRRWRDDAGALVEALGLGPLVGRSAVLDAGWQARLVDFAGALDTAVQQQGVGTLDGLAAASDAVLDHVHARAHSRLPDALAMVQRLARRLHSGSAPTPTRLSDAVAREVADGGWATWARDVAAASALGPASDAIARLLERVDEERARESNAFAALAARWDGARTDGLLGVEHVLDAVVLPVAQAARTLVIVVDGMSQAVARELLAELTVGGWVERRPAESPSRLAALATLPSLTAVSRSALLAGRLGTGEGQSAEREGFAGHEGLRDASRGSGAPLLLHQRDLADDGSGLPSEVREAIDAARRVVGVVVNAVDDFLSAGPQQRPRWTTAEIPVLRALLDAAAESGRAVVLVSDHGHVPERPGSHYVAPGGSKSSGARRRSEDGEPAREGEVHAESARVMTATGQVVLAADPRVRYIAKPAAGYHGGASPEELVAPVIVLTPFDRPLEGLVDQPIDEPAWWREEQPPAAAAAPPPVRKAPRASSAGQLALEGVEAAPPVGTGPDWLAPLLQSPTLADQRNRIGRARLEDERLMAILRVLDAHGGRLTKAALAAQAQLPPGRVDGILAVVRSVLNVEGYAVVSVDAAADAVVLDVAALRAQFGV